MPSRWPVKVSRKEIPVWHRQGHGFLFHQQIFKSSGVQFAVFGKFLHIQVGGARKNVQRFNSNRIHGFSPYCFVCYLSVVLNANGGVDPAKSHTQIETVSYVMKVG